MPERTGVDDARDRGRAALERVGAIDKDARLTKTQEAALGALGTIEKPETPRAVFDFVLALGITNSIDEHTEKMATLATRLNWLTGVLALSTVVLAGATIWLAIAEGGCHGATHEGAAPTAITSA